MYHSVWKAYIQVTWYFSMNVWLKRFVLLVNRFFLDKDFQEISCKVYIILWLWSETHKIYFFIMSGLISLLLISVLSQILYQKLDHKLGTLCKYLTNIQLSLIISSSKFTNDLKMYVMFITDFQYIN
jgi:hypothetical protein